MTGKLEYKVGNLFDNIPQEKTIIAHVVNNCPVAGAGFVIPLMKQYPSWKSDYIYHSNIIKNKYGNKEILGHVHFYYPKEKIEYNNVVIANMYGQDGVGYDEKGNPPIRYLALANAMNRVANEALDIEADIIAPKFGSGLAGGNLEFIKLLIKEIWVNQNINVTIFSLE